MKKHLNIRDLADLSMQASEILEAMLDWSNGKAKNRNEKEEMLEEIVGDLKKQVQSLDEKLDNLS